MSEEPDFPCRKPGCKNGREMGHVFCRDCWFELPKGLRDTVWNEYRKQPGSREHVAAIRACVDFLEGLNT
jgi:hypothetical protein